MLSTNLTLYICVRTPDGKFSECVVREFLPSGSILPMLGVEALDGYPFNGARKAIVRMGNLYTKPINANVAEAENNRS